MAELPLSTSRLANEPVFARVTSSTDAAKPQSHLDSLDQSSSESKCYSPTKSLLQLLNIPASRLSIAKFRTSKANLWSPGMRKFSQTLLLFMDGSSTCWSTDQPVRQHPIIGESVIKEPNLGTPVHATVKKAKNLGGHRTISLPRPPPLLLFPWLEGEVILPHVVCLRERRFQYATNPPRRSSTI